MKSIVFDQPGDPRRVLQLRDLPVPVPRAGQVLVRMLASPINPSDLIFITGLYNVKPALPATPGFEGVGIVEKAGAGLLGRLRRGKRVAVINDVSGNWCEYAVVSDRRIIPVPDDISDEQAGCLFVNPLTALVMIERLLRVPPGAWLLQSAAGSALGRMIIRLGRRNGFRTINVVRRAETIDELKKMGADEVICGEGPGITERVLSITGGEGVRYALDPVGGDTGSALVASLGAQGRILLFGLLSGKPVAVDPRLLLTGGKCVEGFLLSDWAKKQYIPTMLGLLRRAIRLIREGILVTDHIVSRPLSDFASAINEAMSNGKAGKVLLRIGERGRH